ncbi:hypothetical protein KAX14_02585, partial [Candidatus Bipolaricaulota bacterium]|nr:hypothetical protein [Candidatus Bipolaricaulota bacterium]
QFSAISAQQSARDSLLNQSTISLFNWFWLPTPDSRLWTGFLLLITILGVCAYETPRDMLI